MGWYIAREGLTIDFFHHALKLHEIWISVVPHQQLSGHTMSLCHAYTITGFFDIVWASTSHLRITARHWIEIITRIVDFAEWAHGDLIQRLGCGYGCLMIAMVLDCQWILSWFGEEWYREAHLVEWITRISTMSIRHKWDGFGTWIYSSNNGYLIEWWETRMGPPPKMNTCIAFLSSSILMIYPGAYHLHIWLQLQRLYLTTSPSSWFMLTTTSFAKGSCTRISCRPKDYVPTCNKSAPWSGWST